MKKPEIPKGKVLTVAELVGELLKLPPETKVFLQTDPEGNGVEPVTELASTYVTKSGWTWRCSVGRRGLLVALVVPGYWHPKGEG